ncbi:trigger factor [Aliarcobacter butzleri]|jgi:trigger factor|uniref:Trigger factor n=8 Tax=root TaxID=1 RepID=TIG_ALIB4|nr:trigger factor [Aliarcobacter butzleri]A8EVH6.1 RecName: Full=Trigger factor; Short=TF; AltName: Full=PPIase [Aliarcobacter butzleri RM4018]ABV67949.1 trigger factor [Aliarcobacter butzleri RM4018]AGR77936.1 trigger factor (peptidyl-prolyl cis /trans isomerase, chaperone) [Aliarcobacter butzleri 7h1h]EFU68757.1 trigger factor [Aliarcobacter butzleri JV22]KLD96856.1 trigger factor [Aliarcobacter butzleri L349]KLE00216.1 trigger factor [Aliarcobacter butzleri L351]
MEFNANRVDEANAVITATLTKDSIENNLEKVAKQAAKTMNVQGFRKGKVPVAVVKQRYADKLREDAEADGIRKILADGLKLLDIKNSDLIGEPSVTKFDKKDNGDIEVELSVACKPNIDLGDYKSLVPAVKAIEIDIKKIDDRLTEIAQSSAPLEKIARKRAVKDGDFAVIDFEGFVDGVAFDGGKAEKYPLQIGSGSFIPGFEEQVIGMKYEEQKDITVKFPESYQAKDLAGKEAVFKVTLHEIQERAKPELNDEFAQKMLPGQKDVTIDTLRDRVKEQMLAEDKAKYYRDELKPVFLETLVEKINFALPTSVIEQEINYALNNKIRTMTEEEINELKENANKVEDIRNELKEDAVNSVKATFIIDALAKAENVQVSDQEVTQVLYFEAMQMGQNPQDVIKQYQQAGYLPAIKMSMIEEKVISKLLDEKLGK